MYRQLTLDEGRTAQPTRPTWAPPQGRSLLRLAELRAEVRPIYDPGAAPAARRAARETTLEALRRWHYMHRMEGPKDPAMTWSFGLYIAGDLAGVVLLNPPAAGVCQWLYGDTAAWRRRVIAATRTCCADAAPFNSESYLVSAVWRMLPRLDERWTTCVAMSDLSVRDPHGRYHNGGIYAASNAWWAGTSTSGTWRGFIRPETGARLSRKCGGRNRTRDERPEGWEIEPPATLTRFLLFVGGDESETRVALETRVQVAVRQGHFPVWLRPAHVRKGDRRLYAV